MEHLTLKPVYEGKRRGAGRSKKRGFYVGRQLKILDGFAPNILTLRVLDAEKNNKGKMVIILQDINDNQVYHVESEHLKQLIHEYRTWTRK